MGTPDPERVASPARPRRWRHDRDLVVSGAAVVVSRCALGVPLVHTAVMRTQQHASVWPRLTTSLDIDSATLTLAVRNAGVGPAQIDWAQALLDGAPLDGWPALLEPAAAASPDVPRGRLPASIASLTDDVLVPDERKVMLGLSGPLARAVAALSPPIGLRHAAHLSPKAARAGAGAAPVSPSAGHGCGVVSPFRAVASLFGIGSR